MERVICVALCIATVKGTAIILVQLKTLSQPLGEIWVRDEPATKDDKICIARLKLGCCIVTVEATGCDKFHIAFLQDVAKVGKTVALDLDCSFGLNTLAAGRSVCRQRIHLGLLVKHFVEAWLDPRIVSR